MEENKATTEQPAIDIYTDGGCSGNPGPGGWAFLILTNGEITNEGSGHDPKTTNNQMELKAVLESLWEVPEGWHATIHTDSKNVIGWMSGWKRNNPEIRSLCEGIDACVKARNLQLSWQWVRGHSGDRWNELVNEQAQARTRG